MTIYQVLDVVVTTALASGLVWEEVEAATEERTLLAKWEGWWGTLKRAHCRKKSPWKSLWPLRGCSLQIFNVLGWAPWLKEL